MCWMASSTMFFLIHLTLKFQASFQFEAFVLLLLGAFFFRYLHFSLPHVLQLFNQLSLCQREWARLCCSNKQQENFSSLKQVITLVYFGVDEFCSRLSSLQVPRWQNNHYWNIVVAEEEKEQERSHQLLKLSCKTASITSHISTTKVYHWASLLPK